MHLILSLTEGRNKQFCSWCDQIMTLTLLLAIMWSSQTQRVSLRVCLPLFSHSPPAFTRLRWTQTFPSRSGDVWVGSGLSLCLVEDGEEIFAQMSSTSIMSFNSGYLVEVDVRSGLKQMYLIHPCIHSCMYVCLHFYLIHCWFY